MRNRKGVFVLLGISVLLAGCRETPENRESHSGSMVMPSPLVSASAESSPAIPRKRLPESIELIDQAVEIADMTEETPKEGWKPVKSMAFGTFRDNHATLEIYEETGLKDATARVLWGYIKVQGKTFKFPEQLSENLLEEQAESGRSLFVMQRNFPETGSRFYALGGAELMANGPGRIAYAVYDATDDRWKAFEQWGTPAFVDLDGDGNKEFLIVFPGLHNQLPDIKLLSWWEQKNLLTTANVRDAFPVGEHVYAGIDAGKQAITVGYMDEADGAAKAYRLKDHMLIRFPQ